QFGILGKGTDVYSSVFHMKVSAGGSLSYYNGSSWISVGGSDTVTFNSWNLIHIMVSDTERAKVYVNDSLVGIVENWIDSERMGGIRFATAGSNQTGDKFYVDHVSVKGDNGEGEHEIFNPPINDTFESDTAGEIPEGYNVTGSNAGGEALVSS